MAIRKSLLWYWVTELGKGIFSFLAIMKNQFSIKNIGVVRSELKSLSECPLQEAEGAPDAMIEVFPEFQEGLEGIVVGSKLILITWLNKANRTILKCYPRNEINSPHVGVFTTRSPDRPNPIGLHHVTVVEIPVPGTLKVFALEVLDGTPVIDIKPVIYSVMLSKSDREQTRIANVWIERSTCTTVTDYQIRATG